METLIENRGKVDAAPVLTGPGGDYMRAWPADGEHPGPMVPCPADSEGRDSLCGGLEWVVPVVLMAAAWILYCFWG